MIWSGLVMLSNFVVHTDFGVADRLDLAKLHTVCPGVGCPLCNTQSEDKAETAVQLYTGAISEIWDLCTDTHAEDSDSLQLD